MWGSAVKRLSKRVRGWVSQPWFLFLLVSLSFRLFLSSPVVFKWSKRNRETVPETVYSCYRFNSFKNHHSLLLLYFWGGSILFITLKLKSFTLRPTWPVFPVDPIMPSSPYPSKTKKKRGRGQRGLLNNLQKWTENAYVKHNNIWIHRYCKSLVLNGWTSLNHTIEFILQCFRFIIGASF